MSSSPPHRQEKPSSLRERSTSTPSGTTGQRIPSTERIRASDLDHREDAARDNWDSIERHSSHQRQQQQLPPLRARSSSYLQQTPRSPRPHLYGAPQKKEPTDATTQPKEKFKTLARRVMKVKEKQHSSRSLMGSSRRAAPISSASTAVLAVMAQQRSARRLQQLQKPNQEFSSRHRKTRSAAHDMLHFMKEISAGNQDDDDDDEEDDEGDTNVLIGEAMPGTDPNNSDKLFMAADIAPQQSSSDETSVVVSEMSFGEMPPPKFPKDQGFENDGDQADEEKGLLHPKQQERQQHQHNYGTKGVKRSTAIGGDGQGSGGYGSLVAGVRQNRVIRQKGRSKFIRHMRRFCSDYLCNPKYWCTLIYTNVLHSLVVYLAVPCFITAWVLFYYVGNPTFDFLPAGATRLSWWLNFVGRQVLVLELSRFSQWILLDCFVLGTRWSVKFLGPLVTLTAIQAKGWPFIVAAWGALGMVLLHGDNNFQQHWFHRTGWMIYNSRTGVNVLSSSMYLRVLVAMIVAGLAATTKRAALAVYFGRRQLVEFKPRLEKLLGDIVLLSEVATLGEEAELVAQETDTTLDSIDGPVDQTIGTPAMVHNNVHFTGGISTSELEKTETAPQEQNDDMLDAGILPKASTGDDSSFFMQDDEDEIPDYNRYSSRRLLAKNSSHDLSRTMSGTFHIKSLLDRWDEPVTKNDKHAQSATIEDVLRFRRALACMDEEHPFGEAFGPAGSRDACIQSASSLYRHLMKLDPTMEQLAFEVLALAIVEDDTSDEYEMKTKAFRRLFRPDVNGELPLLAFVQSCDTIYRRLRYFIASVRNSSVIDKALEDTFNGFFFFVLSLLLMFVLRLNPWPMLVSVTSLLVSISFALGPSVSKYVEGALLIAVRRPYDLGDRIIISDSNSLQNPGVAESWFVEDINLWSTTLRYARSNEVSTINNSAIASSRIINCNRSPNAIVMFLLITNINVLYGTKMDDLRAAAEKFVKDHPRTWEAVSFIGHEDYDADWEKIYIRLTFRHRNSWQDAARILQNRGQLHQFLFETGKRMEINFQTPPLGRVIYQGGEYKKKHFSEETSSPWEERGDPLLDQAT